MGTTAPRYVITGPPASGKTKWVEAHRQPGDMVWDMDAIAQTLCQCPRYPRPPHVMDLCSHLRSSFLNAAATYPAAVYVIITDGAEAQRIAERIGAKLIEMQASAGELAKRKQQRGDNPIANF